MQSFTFLFPGRYEHPVSGYKHVYFNATHQTLKIWLVTVMAVIGAYEALRHLYHVIRSRTFRPSMGLLFLSSLYPHYYSWWSYFGYWNEDFYYQWWHQMYFSITEIASTIMVLHLANTNNKVLPWKLLLVISINTMHIIVNGLDQFIIHIFYREGQGFENARNIGLMIPDLLQVSIPVYELFQLAKKQKTSVRKLFYREELMMAVLLVTLSSLLGKNL